MFGGNYSDVAKDFLRLLKLKTARPDLVSLEVLMKAFSRFPYENFTKIVRAREFEGDNRMRLPDIVLCDHIDLGAGGTCFSLTYFFEQVLKFFGYDVYPVLCDRSYGPDTHSALIAKIGELRYLVDPGYLMDAPLFIPPEGETKLSSKISATRLLRLGTSSQLLLFSERGDKSKLRYRMRDTPVTPEIFKKRWLDSFEWAMMRHPCISRITADGQIFMRDGVMRKNEKDFSYQEIIKNTFAEKVSKAFGIESRIVDRALSYLPEKKCRI